MNGLQLAYRAMHLQFGSLAVEWVTQRVSAQLKLVALTVVALVCMNQKKEMIEQSDIVVDIFN